MDDDVKGKIGVQGLRASRPRHAATDTLGALQDLPGFWEGPGFSLIARPSFDPDHPGGTDGRPAIFLQLNLLEEMIEFRAIGSPVVNRGSVQEDIVVYGVTYLHRVTDATIGGALHIEPGMWLNIPETHAPDAKPSIARLATIPHGNAICAVGFVQHAEFDRIPQIPPANTVPFPVGGTAPPPGTKNHYAEFDLSIPNGQRTAPLPPQITQALIDDPIQMLRDVLDRQVNSEGKTLKKITRLITDTQGAAQVANLPYITANANAVDVQSVFAIEEVVDPNGFEFLQLQYVQTALLQFGGMCFPHVTVGTLIKAF